MRVSRLLPALLLLAAASRAGAEPYCLKKVDLCFGLPDYAPFVEIVFARGQVRDPEHDRAVYEKAREVALKDAVRQVIWLYTPADVHPSRMGIYESTLIPKYKDYILHYSQRGHQPVCERKDEMHEVSLQAMVLGVPLRRDMLKMGLLRPGNHIEFALLSSHFKGGSGGSNPGPGGSTVNNQPYSGDLFGMMGRYYFTDRYFGEINGMLLTSPAEVGSYVDALGNRAALQLLQYDPMEMLAGWKFFDRWHVRGNLFAGHTVTLIDYASTPLISPVERQYYVHGWMLGADASWAPLRWLGFGLRAEYNTRAHYDVVTEKMADRWRFSEEFFFWF